MNPVVWFNVTDLTRGLYLNPRSPLIDWLPLYLDYLQFFALLGWTLVLLGWWWQPRKVAWQWVPWTAAIGLLHVLVEFLSVQLAVFGNSRANSIVVDHIQCALWLAAAAAWLWTAPAITGRKAGRFLRWVVLAPMAVAAAQRSEHPGAVAWFMAGAGTMAAIPWFYAAGATAWSRLALGAFALCPAVSTTGPLAHIGFMDRFSFVPSLLEPWSAGWQAVAAFVILAGLGRQILTQVPVETRAELGRELRPYALRALTVVGVGLTAATIWGEMEYRRAIEHAVEQVREVRAQVDTANLDRLLNGDFRIEGLEPGHYIPWLKATEVRARRLASPEARILRATLDSLLAPAAGTIQAISVVTLRAGNLIALCGKLKTPGYPGQPPVFRQLSPAFLGRPATAEDQRDWDTRAEVYERSSFAIGSSSFNLSRVPLTAPDGRMLGWLEFQWPYNAQLLAAQKVRAVPFIATVLGVALVALFFVQAQHARARERAVRQAAVEAEGNRVKTAFLASVSHELRTPLQSILGYSELLRPEVTSEAGRTRLGALRDQGTLMIRLVNDLIDLSAVEAGSFQLSPRATALADIIRQAVESLRPRAAGKGLDLRLELADDLPAWVEVDDGRLRQVLINLAGNAIKFTDRGAVTISLRVEQGEAGRDRLILIVQDTGPGIPVDQQDRLFTPFNRLAQTADKEGSGLGLAITAALCRAMGGGVSVASDGRTGCRFTVTLRVQAVEAPPPTRPPAVAAAGISPRVLIVDDNRLVRELFLATLGGRGAVCRAVATGTAAVAACTEEKPGVIVLDLALPDGDGTDHVSRLRAIVPGVRIIGVSAHAGAADRTRALAAGMDDFLLKPVLLDELWAAVAWRAPVTPRAVTHFDTPVVLRERLVEEFRRELPARQAELAEAMQAGDLDRMRTIAHYLRNSALVVRADELFVACTGLEAAATDNAAELPSWGRRCLAALAAFSA